MNINQRKWHREVTAMVALAFMLLATAVRVAAQDQAQPYPELDQQLKQLKDKFNADVGKVRVLVIGDPTCPPCRLGFSTIQKNVVEKFGSDKLAVYAVWVPLLNLQDPATLQRHAHQYAGLIPSGPRTSVYTDPQAYSGKKYGPILGVPYGSPAWDVYLTFSADARWGETPPTPAYWEHQLGGLDSARYLDGPRFAEEVRKLLAKVGQ
jgi:hypothetical protein